jgi:tetratricopeptide (TPR) repeat protein
VAWAEVATRSGGKPAGQQVLAQYRQARAPVDAGSAARLDLLEAGFAGDRQREVQALWKLAELRPNDVASLLSLADLAQRLQQNDQAEKALLRVVRLEPGLAPQWNTLAYVQAYQGKTEAALQSAAEYEKLDPGSPNPLDSRGEILFMAGRFAEAESAFLACARKEPDFNSGVALEKAALARMLGGDVGGAGAIAGRYLQQRGEKQDALTAFHQARWDWLLGRRGPALQRMQALAQSEGVSAGLAAAKMAVWAMETGDEGAAREWAQLSAKKAKRPGDQLAAAMALSVAGFGQTVRGLPPQAVVELEAVRRTWKGEFGPASELWEKVEKAGGLALGHTVGGWAYLRAGRAEDARRCAASPWPILTTDQLLLFDSTVFQSALYLRAEAAQGAKQTAEARKYFDVYLRSMGDAKDRFGQLAKARGEARL